MNDFEQNKNKVVDFIKLITLFGFIYNIFHKVHKIDPSKMKIGERKQLSSNDTIISGAGVEYTIEPDFNGVKWIVRTK